MTQTLLERWVQKSAQKPAQKPVQGHNPSSTTTAISADTAVQSSPQQTNDYVVDVKTAGSESSGIAAGQSNRLHSKVSLVKPEKDDIPRLKRLNSLLLPIPYPESFYKEIQSDPQAQSLTLLAFWSDSASTEDTPRRNGQLIGAVRCRLLESTESPGCSGPMLYVSTLVLLSPYRSLGIASCMLNAMIRRGVQDYGVTSIGAHVWDANTAALGWYHKRGFKEIGHDPSYYRKLSPHGAKIMSRSLSALDLTGG